MPRGVDGKEKAIQDWRDKNLSHIRDFREFVYKLENPSFARIVLNQKHFCPQWRWISDETGKIDIDFLGSVEIFHEDIQKLCQQLDLPVPNQVKVKNSSGGHKTDDYYNGSMKQIVQVKYKHDFELLGYPA